MLAYTASLLGVGRGTVRVFAQAALRSKRSFSTTADVEESDVLDIEAVDYSVDDFNELIKSEEDRQLVHLILLEIATLREETGRGPFYIQPRHMSDLLQLSPMKRQKYFNFMFKTQVTKHNAAKRRQRLRLEREARFAEDLKEPKDCSGIYPYIRKPQIYNQLHGLNLSTAAQFGQKLFLDCSFEKNMSNRELGVCAFQMQMAYSVNKYARNPFDLAFCGLKTGGYLEDKINTYFVDHDTFPYLIDRTPKSYLEIVPKKDLVYLSPNARTVLEKWDHGAAYIIGAIVDLGTELPLTYARAKEENIKCARLPLKEMSLLKPGAQRALPLNTIVSILLSFKETGDWREALRNLPSRFVVHEEQRAEIMAHRARKADNYQRKIRQANFVNSNVFVQQDFQNSNKKVYSKKKIKK